MSRNPNNPDGSNNGLPDDNERVDDTDRQENGHSPTFNRDDHERTVLNLLFRIMHNMYQMFYVYEPSALVSVFRNHRGETRRGGLSDTPGENLGSREDNPPIPLITSRNVSRNETFEGVLGNRFYYISNGSINSTGNGDQGEFDDSPGGDVGNHGHNNNSNGSIISAGNGDQGELDDSPGGDVGSRGHNNDSNRPIISAGNGDQEESDDSTWGDVRSREDNPSIPLITLRNVSRNETFEHVEANSFYYYSNGSNISAGNGDQEESDNSPEGDVGSREDSPPIPLITLLNLRWNEMLQRLDENIHNNDGNGPISADYGDEEESDESSTD